MKYDDDQKRAVLLDFAIRSFRNVADQDYISARAVFRLGLIDQAMTFGQQAVEKYLKAIIVIHSELKVKPTHDLRHLLAQVEEIHDIPWDFREIERNVMADLDYFGGDRYFSISRSGRGEIDLMRLDYTIWSVRRYCQNFQYLREGRWGDGQEFMKYAKWLGSDELRMGNPGLFRLQHKGHIEEVLDTEKHPKQRAALVWKNAFFSSRRRKAIRLRNGWWMRNATYFVFPDSLGFIEERIEFPKGIRRKIKEQLGNEHWGMLFPPI